MKQAAGSRHGAGKARAGAAWHVHASLLKRGFRCHFKGVPKGFQGFPRVSKGFQGFPSNSERICEMIILI